MQQQFNSVIMSDKTWTTSLLQALIADYINLHASQPASEQLVVGK